PVFSEGLEFSVRSSGGGDFVDTGGQGHVLLRERPFGMGAQGQVDRVIADVDVRVVIGLLSGLGDVVDQADGVGKSGQVDGTSDHGPLGVAGPVGKSRQAVLDLVIGEFHGGSWSPALVVECVGTCIPAAGKVSHQRSKIAEGSFGVGAA